MESTADSVRDDENLSFPPTIIEKGESQESLSGALEHLEAAAEVTDSPLVRHSVHRVSGNI